MFNALLSLTKHNTCDPPIFTSSRGENLLNFVCKQYRTKQHIDKSYQKLKGAMVKLHDDYIQMKGRNIFSKYTELEHMIREVIMLEKQYWQLIDLPVYEPSEPANDYVSRVMELIANKKIWSSTRNGIASLLSATLIVDNAAETIIYKQLRGLSASDLKDECDRMYVELYKLSRKYLALRKILQELNSNFHLSRFLPIIPRYNLLKSMVKSVVREPAFIEMYHELH